MKKTSFLIIIFLTISSFGIAQQKRVQFSLLGGINHIFEYGSIEDYVAGETDFPVVPSHSPLNFGLALAFFFSDSVGLEFDGHYTQSKKVTLQDPSDQDTVEVDTSTHYTFSANLIFQIPEGIFRPYFLIGGGIDILSVEDQVYNSEFGYEVEILAPERKTDFLVQGGGGILLFISQDFGVRIDARYIYIFADPNAVKSLNATAGIIIRF
ncbi:outer membrane beta-barrel protein [Acidobacteriota bacterium]